MKIFHALMRRKHMPNGHIYRGKDRIVKPVTKDDYCKLKQEFETQEKNMFYLRHSYLTPEQSCGHAKALNKHKNWFIQLITQKKQFYDPVTIEARLGHLRHKECWD